MLCRVPSFGVMLPPRQSSSLRHLFGAGALDVGPVGERFAKRRALRGGTARSARPRAAHHGVDSAPEADLREGYARLLGAQMSRGATRHQLAKRDKHGGTSTSRQQTFNYPTLADSLQDRRLDALEPHGRGVGGVRGIRLPVERFLNAL